MDVNDSNMYLDTKESYETMLQFLKNWYDLTKNSDLTDILSGAEYFEDGKPADSAFLDYWKEAINEVKKGNNDPFKKWDI